MYAQYLVRNPRIEHFENKKRAKKNAPCERESNLDDQYFKELI